HHTIASSQAANRRHHMTRRGPGRGMLPRGNGKSRLGSGRPPPNAGSVRSMDDAGSPGYLRALLAFIRGEGPPHAPGTPTPPGSSDEGDRAKDGACLELERRGQVGRRIDRPDLVSWIPRKAADGDATRDRARPG